MTIDPVVVHERLEAVFRRVFDDASIVISNEMTADDVDDWDSLEHINLIIACEREFSVRFMTAEIAGLKNVGEFEAILRTKLEI